MVPPAILAHTEEYNAMTDVLYSTVNGPTFLVQTGGLLINAKRDFHAPVKQPGRRMPVRTYI